MQNEKQSKKNMNVGGDKTCKWAFRNARKLFKKKTNSKVGLYIIKKY
ncbi:hypothetical protein HGD80_03085 [Paulownia witches'-broom phytoplasma]|uniref:Uncharacterized protein n=1 Tax=Paulownia witches'-broom phytoplasma TaxID=39647 RepID=A0ABX8TMU4_9MOLU|nr:hypothetical protein [Paulownia witches'-broom phytoplasma]QYC30774.1 hypothetical protein HGD80_03085 [Paulownia witches'-broom phytoplasma]